MAFDGLKNKGGIMKKIISAVGLLVLAMALAAQETYIQPTGIRPSSASGTWFKSGDVVKISVDVYVAGATQKMVAFAETDPALGPPPPSVVAGDLAPGEHTVMVFMFTVPERIPSTLTIKIKVNGQVMVENMKFKFGHSNSTKYLKRDENASVILNTIYPVPQPVPGGGNKPDLVIKMQKILTYKGMVPVLKTVFVVHNLGNAAAQHIDLRYECFINGQWMPGGWQLERIQTVIAGSGMVVKNTEKCKCLSAATKWRLVVDPGKEIQELNEDNNTYEISF